MKNNSPRHLAFKTLIKHKRYSLNNYIDLKSIIESKQFTVIEYKKYNNSSSVSALITRLNVANEVAQNNCFLYISGNLKFVFINADVSEEDKCALLRHELGHICDPGFTGGNVGYSNVKREEFANEFSCYAKQPGICFVIYAFLMKKWKQLACVLGLIACVLGVVFVYNTMPASPVTSATDDAPYSLNSEDAYYVTSSGKKYHHKWCIVVKYKNNLTEIRSDDAVNEGYKPCMICNPEK